MLKERSFRGLILGGWRRNISGWPASENHAIWPLYYIYTAALNAAARSTQNTFERTDYLIHYYITNYSVNCRKYLISNKNIAY